MACGPGVMFHTSSGTLAVLEDVQIRTPGTPFHNMTPHGLLRASKQLQGGMCPAAPRLEPSESSGNPGRPQVGTPPWNSDSSGRRIPGAEFREVAA